jgi:hypothetical protein
MFAVVKHSHSSETQLNRFSKFREQAKCRARRLSGQPAGIGRSASWQSASRRNLSKRLPKPALGRGRVQRMARRAFLAEGPELTTTAILDWAYVRRRGSPLPLGLYWSLHRALAAIGAVRVRRSGERGNPWVWRLTPEHAVD